MPYLGQNPTSPVKSGFVLSENFNWAGKPNRQVEYLFKTSTWIFEASLPLKKYLS
jgi:hypothetical protein